MMMMKYFSGGWLLFEKMMMKYFPIGWILGKNSERGGDEVDRISDLPDSVVHHILKFLEMKDVVQTSLVSKRWRYVWKSHPFLNFNSMSFRRPRGLEYFVGNVLVHRDSSSSMQSFHLIHIGDGDLYTWILILIALRSKVQDLYLDVYRQKIFRDHVSHECLFTCESLTKLELHCCESCDGRGPPVLYLPDSMSLPNLKTLFLHGFRVEYSENMANNNFSSCRFPVLESLDLYGCTFPKTSGLYISSTQLKRLVIINYVYSYHRNVDPDGEEYPIKLCAPNLLTFVCRDRFLLRDYSIESLPAVVRAEIGLGTNQVPYFDDIDEGKLYSQQMMMFLSAVHNVETLTLRAPFLKAVSGNNVVLESASIQLCNLRCLKLETWLSVDCMNSITFLLNISPNIEFLSLDITREDVTRYPLSMHSVLDEVHWVSGLSLNHLKDVEIHGALGYEDELMFMEILLKKAMVLESVTLYTPKERQSHHSTYTTYTEFLEILLKKAIVLERCDPLRSKEETKLVFKLQKNCENS